MFQEKSVMWMAKPISPIRKYFYVSNIQEGLDNIKYRKCETFQNEILV